MSDAVKPTAPVLRSLDDTVADVLRHAQPLAATQVLDLFECDGRVLAQDLLAPLNVPGFDNAQMDGYALRCSDVPAVATVLPVSQRIAAGHFGQALASGTVARIFTGAPMPEGADAVAMQEDCVAQADQRVQFNSMPTPGQWVRRKAEDIAVGQVVLSANQRFGPAQMGLAASMGFATVPVRSKPKVALFSTGDELITPGAVAPKDLKPGSIYNSNRFFLRALLKRWGCEVLDLGVVGDTQAATCHALASAAEQADLIITSGGVGVGEEDHVKPAVRALGSLDLWQVNMKPGKPFAFGHVQSLGHTAFVMGLPGNPVSSFVTALLLVRPFVRALQGLDSSQPASVEATALTDGPKADKRREFLRVKTQRMSDGRLGFECFPNQNSSVLTSMHWADALADRPGSTVYRSGDPAQVLMLSDLLI